MHEDLMKSPQQLGADGNDGPREAEAMGGHAGGPGVCGFWIACGSLSGMKGDSRDTITPSRAPRLSGLFYVFRVWGARPRDPGGALGRLH